MIRRSRIAFLFFLTLSLSSFFLLSTSAFAQKDMLDQRVEEFVQAFSENPPPIAHIFTNFFLTQVPESRLFVISKDYYVKYGSVTKTMRKGAERGSTLYELTFSKGFTVPMRISLLPDEGSKISGLWIGSAAPTISSMTALLDSLQALPGVTELYIGAIRARGGKPFTDSVIVNDNADKRMPLGSAFKLWILAALIEDIEHGKRNWADVVSLNEASVSVPSGVLQDWPTGTPMTLASLAGRMISQSDNTATDLLLHTLGRERVEAMLTTTSHSYAADNIPFLSTREMFVLKSIPGMANRYLKMDLAKKRQLLDSLKSVSTRIIEGYSSPTKIDEIEWFGRAYDVRNVLLWLKNHTESPQTSLGREILSINPILNFDKDHWKYRGGKGGSEPGVMYLSFLLQDQSGKWYIVIAGNKNTKAPVDERHFIGLIERAVGLMEK